MKFLIVEDEPNLLEAFEKYFVEQNNSVHKAANKFTAEDELLEHQFDFVILDIGLPDGNGLDLLKIIKKYQRAASVIIVSAKNALDDKLTGLDLGADDYITKPFHIAELNSRIKAINRRKLNLKDDFVVFNEIKCNPQEQLVFVHDKLLELTKKEFQLLVYFISNQNRVLTKEAIADHLWENQSDFMANYDFIYTHIKNLRKKIESAGGTDYLKTIYGLGYKYTEA